MTLKKPQNISLNVDGKHIEIKNSFKLNSELNKALLNKDEFIKFCNNPQVFAKKFKLDIDETISNRLKEKLKGINSIDELKEKFCVNSLEPDERTTTVWAVAVGAYSLASTKVAVVI